MAVLLNLNDSVWAARGARRRASSTHLQIVNTEVVAFFNKHLQGDMRYHRYLLPSYTPAKKLAAEVEYCKATPGNAEVCFDKHRIE